MVLVSSAEDLDGSDGTSRSFLIEKLECIDPGSEAACVACFDKLPLLSNKLPHEAEEKRELDEELAVLVGQAKRCRTLKGMPTDVSLPDI